MVGKYIMKSRVSSFEVGRTRKLKPSAILMLIQEAAGRHLESDGLSYEFMRSKGIVFLLVKEAVKISRLPSCGEEISIETWFERTTGAQFLRGMRFLDEDEGILIEAQTCWIIANPQTHRIMRPSAFPFEMPCVGRDGITVEPERIKLPETAVEAGIREVRYSDIDCNNHMNNAVYIDIACDYFPGGLGEREISQFQINYEGEASLGDQIKVRTEAIESGAVFEGTINGHKCFETLVITK
jgi:acyl-ACP thioesterase